MKTTRRSTFTDKTNSSIASSEEFYLTHTPMLSIAARLIDSALSKEEFSYIIDLIANY